MYDQRGLIRLRSKDESDTSSKTLQTSVPFSDVMFSGAKLRFRYHVHRSYAPHGRGDFIDRMEMIIAKSGITVQSCDSIISAARDNGSKDDASIIMGHA